MNIVNYYLLLTELAYSIPSLFSLLYFNRIFAFDSAVASVIFV